MDLTVRWKTDYSCGSGSHDTGSNHLVDLSIYSNRSIQESYTALMPRVTAKAYRLIVLAFLIFSYNAVNVDNHDTKKNRSSTDIGVTFGLAEESLEEDASKCFSSGRSQCFRSIRRDELAFQACGFE